MSLTGPQLALGRGKSSRSLSKETATCCSLLVSPVQGNFEGKLLSTFPFQLSRNSFCTRLWSGLTSAGSFAASQSTAAVKSLAWTIISSERAVHVLLLHQAWFPVFVLWADPSSPPAPSSRSNSAQAIVHLVATFLSSTLTSQTNYSVLNLPNSPLTVGKKSIQADAQTQMAVEKL